MRAALLLAVMAALTFGALQLPWPFAYVLPLWAVFLGVAVWRTRRGAVRRHPARRLALLGLGLVAPLAVIEVVLVLAPNVGKSGRMEGTYPTAALWGEHPEFGYAPTPGVVATARSIQGERVVYDVTYTYDAHGQRVSAPVAAPPAKASVLCVGCSFTLGEGVSDTESYPYRVGELSGRTLEVHNFGFHGYGPHQSLAALQSGIAAEVAESPVALVVYLAIPDHIVRVAGRKTWDPAGPWYVLEDGALRRAGNFDDRAGPAFPSRAWFFDTFAESALVQRLRQNPGDLRPVDIALYEAIVAELRAESSQRFPGAAFHLLAWEGPPEWWDCLRRLEARGVPVHAVHGMVPGLAEGARIPTIPGDPHPTPAVQDAIARFVVEQLVR